MYKLVTQLGQIRYKMLILGFGVVGFVRQEGERGAGIPDRCSSQAKAGLSGEPCP